MDKFFFKQEYLRPYGRYDTRPFLWTRIVRLLNAHSLMQHQYMGRITQQHYAIALAAFDATARCAYERFAH